MVPELVGTEATLPKIFACLAAAGTLVVICFQPEAVFAIDSARFVTDGLFVTGSRYVNHAELAEAEAWAEAGRVKQVISRTYPLAEAARTIADLAANRIMGRAPTVPNA